MYMFVDICVKLHIQISTNITHIIKQLINKIIIIAIIISFAYFQYSRSRVSPTVALKGSKPTIQ